MWGFHMEIKMLWAIQMQIGIVGGFDSTAFFGTYKMDKA